MPATNTTTKKIKEFAEIKKVVDEYRDLKALLELVRNRRSQLPGKLLEGHVRIRTKRNRW